MVWGAVAALLAACPLRAEDRPPWAPDLAALGVPLDQLPQADAMLQAELDKITAAGEPLDFAELAPPEVPDEENAALVYAQAFAALHGEYHDPADLQGNPAPPPPGEAGAGGPPPGGPPPTGTLAESEEQYVAENADTLALIEKAAAMPRCRFPVDWTQGGAALFPHLHKLRTCVDLLAIDARVQASHGDTDEALRLCGVGLSLGKSVEKDPSIICDLVRWAMSDIIAEDGLAPALGVRRLAKNGTPPVDPPPPLPSTAACQALFTELGQFPFQSTLHRDLLAERATVIVDCDQIRNDPYEAFEDQGFTHEDFPVTPAIWAAFMGTPQGKQVLALDEVTYLRRMAQAIPKADKPWREIAHDPEVSADLPAYCVVSKNTLNVERLVARRDRCLADIGQAQVALALVAYHNQTGQWPASLAEVRQTVGWELPLDPFSGQDFVYRQEGPGFVLYSVGPDLRDDGGAAITYPPQGEAVGDLTWRKP
jgi:hypothetical protein